MKKLILSLMITMMATTTFAAKQVTCQSAAEDAAVAMKNKQIKEEFAENAEPGEVISDDLLAAVSETYNVGADGEPSDQDTGTYTIGLIVWEECMEGVEVQTKMSTPKKGAAPKCEIIKVESLGSRDCG